MQEAKQLHLDLGIPLEPPKDLEVIKPEDASIEERREVMQDNASNINVPVVQPTVDSCIMPTTLQSAAQSSMSLRSVQQKLAGILTDESYLGLIAGTNPEVLPTLLDSVTNSVAVSDNLMIQMAKVAEKNASMNRVFEYLTKKQESKNSKDVSTVDKDDEMYKQSISKIKTAIYNRLNIERNAHPKTAQDFINVEHDIRDNAEVIEIEAKEVINNPQVEVVDIDAEEFPVE